MSTESNLILIVSAVIAIVALVMPFTHINKKFGVRTKWSMHNDKTWFYSNLLGAIFLLLSSAATVFSFYFYPDILKVVFISSICVAGALSVLFSYFIYNCEIKKNNTK